MSSETNLAYLAGIIDGEGSIFIGKNKNFRIKISNTNEILLKEIMKISINECINFNIYDAGNNTDGKDWKKGYQLQIADKKQILECLRKVHPYLIAKKAQAIIMMDIIEDRIDYDEGYDIIKLLNKKGEGEW